MNKVLQSFTNGYKLTSYIREATITKENTMEKERINYVMENYTCNNAYDLTASLMCDNFTDDIRDLTSIVDAVLGGDNSEDVLEAYNDYL